MKPLSRPSPYTALVPMLVERTRRNTPRCTCYGPALPDHWEKCPVRLAREKQERGSADTVN